MSYVTIQSDTPFSALNKEDGQTKFHYKSSLTADLSQSFVRMFISFEDGNGTPIQFGDWLHINDLFTDSLWKNVRINDIANGVQIQSSTQSHLQSVAMDLLQPSNNNIGGIVSNSALTIMRNGDGYINVGNQLGLWVPQSDGLNQPFDNIRTPLDLSIGHNSDDFNQHHYARWGETLEPFPLPTQSDGDAVPAANNLMLTIKNKAGLARLKRQFLYDFKNVTSVPPVENIVPYIYKPNWCDMWRGDKSYMTNDLILEVVRGSVLNSVQYQSVLGAGSGTGRFPNTNDISWLLGSNERKGVQIKIQQAELVMFVTAKPMRSPRMMIWTTDLRQHVLDAPYFNRRSLIQGPYDFVLISFVKNKSLARTYGVKDTELCHYRSGLSLKLLNNNKSSTDGDMPTLPLTDMTYFVDHGDSITQIPSTERYRVIDIKRNPDNVESIRIDLMLPYFEYLKACGLNPFTSANDRAKIDYCSYISQMLYVPVSLRKDGEYFSSEPQPVTVLGCELNFDSERFIRNEEAGTRFILNVIGFRKVFL